MRRQIISDRTIMKRRQFISKNLAGLTSFISLPFLLSFIPTKNIKKQTLPKVLLLGDSISIGYFPYVKDFLRNQAEVTRPFKPDGKPENCQGTTYGISNVERWIGTEKWDIIHFNFGLHDLKHVDPLTGKNSQNPEDPRQAEPKTYKKQLTKITRILKATRAKLIFATTTPYPDEVGGPYRAFKDEEFYNRIAMRIMKKFEIPINDLHAFVLPQMKQLQRSSNVHFTDEGSKALAEQVSTVIMKYV